MYEGDSSTTPAPERRAGVPDVSWLPVPLLVMDARGYCHAVAPATLRILECGQSELAGQAWRDWMCADADNFVEQIAQVARTREAKTVASHPRCCPERRMRFTIQPIDGSAGLVSVNVADITAEEADRAEHARIEDRLALVVEASRKGIWDWMVGADSVFVSDRFKEILALDLPGDTITVDMARDLIHPEDLDHLRTQVADIVSGRDVRESEIRLRRADGRIIWVQIKAIATTADDGKSLRVVGTIGDISERKEAEETLRRARADALAASHAKSEFVAMVSHELRTPLNGIIGMLDLLAHAGLDGEKQPLVDTATESARSLLAILDDLLDLSKLDAGRVELHAATFEPASLVEGVVQLFEPGARKRNLGLSCKIVGDVPATLEADRGRLRQILANLVGNAVKFTESGEVQVETAFEPATGTEPDRLRFTVQDTGIGISPEAQRQLFMPFTQAGRNTFERFGGTGLGLAICKRLAQMMGGDIGVDSKEGEGSRFWFTVAVKPARAGGEAKTAEPDNDDRLRNTIPDEPKPAEASAPAPKPEQKAEAALPAPDEKAVKAHLLVAEDNLVNQRVIAAMLSKLGYSFDIVDDGAKAVEAVRDGDYAAVLMDIQMPRVDGVMATRLIREEQRDTGVEIPIIAITAHAVHGTREEYLAAGMSEFISKPIDVRTLARILAQFCGKDGGAENTAASRAASA